jgi:DNA-binding NarL/FixJ family response regulator
MFKRIRVMVVDDSLQFASALAQFLACNGNFEVLASANSAGEALARTSNERPDLMFIDISMPGMNGFAVASLIKGGEAAPKIVMMTLEDSEEHRIGAMAAGADAFLPKDNFAHGLHAVVELLFGASALNKESGPPAALAPSLDT